MFTISASALEIQFEEMLRCLFFVFQFYRATVLYDQPPEFFHPASLEEKHKVHH